MSAVLRVFGAAFFLAGIFCTWRAWQGWEMFAPEIAPPYKTFAAIGAALIALGGWLLW